MSTCSVSALVCYHYSSLVNASIGFECFEKLGLELGLCYLPWGKVHLVTHQSTAVLKDCVVEDGAFEAESFSKMAVEKLDICQVALLYFFIKFSILICVSFDA